MPAFERNCHIWESFETRFTHDLHKPKPSPALFVCLRSVHRHDLLPALSLGRSHRRPAGLLALFEDVPLDEPFDPLDVDRYRPMRVATEVARLRELRGLQDLEDFHGPILPRQVTP